MNTDNNRHQIIEVSDKDLEKLNEILNLVYVDKFKNYELINDALNSLNKKHINFEKYQELYTSAVSDTKKTVEIFRKKISIMYLYNLINEHLNKDNIYRFVLKGMIESLESNLSYHHVKSMASIDISDIRDKLCEMDLEINTIGNMGFVNPTISNAITHINKICNRKKNKVKSLQKEM